MSRAPSPLNFGAFHSYAARVFDVSEWIDVAARHVLKNHREIRRDERGFHNHKCGSWGRGREGSKKLVRPSVRHVAALPRARFVSNGAGEIDFLRRQRPPRRSLN